MNIYLISQSEENSYDTYDSAVVIARSPNRAKQIHPYTETFPLDDGVWDDEDEIWRSSVWASSPDKVSATYVGVAGKEWNEGDVVCTSFNAG